MRIASSVLLFVGIFYASNILGGNIFPVTDENELLAPAWYMFLSVFVSIFVPYIVMKITDPNPKPNRVNWLLAGPKKRYSMAVRATEDFGHVSESYLQRKFGISYRKARTLADRLVKDRIANRLTDVVGKREVPNICKTEEPSHPSAQPQPLSNDFIKYGGVNAELLTVDLMDGHSFEYWCAAVLLKNRFSSAEVTPGSGDHGVDVVAVKDEVRYAIQCKCYHADLGNSPVQEVYAGKEMYGCQVGVVMTNRHFTKGAKELAGKTKVLLWDRDKLAALIESAEKDF